MQKYITFHNSFNVTINDISVVHVTAYRCAGGLNKLDPIRATTP